MKENDLQDVRRRRLAAWLAEHGGLAKVGTIRRLTASYQSYLSQCVNGGSFGSRAARKCEELLGMPSLWLDAPAHEPISAGGADATVVHARENVASFTAGLAQSWPHVGVTHEQWIDLTADERLQLDAALMAAYAAVLRQRRERETTAPAGFLHQSRHRPAA